MGDDDIARWDFLLARTEVEKLHSMREGAAMGSRAAVPMDI